jgi:membrane-anchored protein YejM (alkaline phosphatase superfamily)
MSSLTTRKIYFNWIFWFFTGNALLFWGIGLHYLAIIIPFHLSVSSLANQVLACLFLFSAFFGQLGLFACLAAILPIIIVILYPKKTLIFSSSVLIGFFVAYLLCFDTFVFSQYHFHLNGVIWNLLTSGQAKEVFDLSWLEWLYIGLLSGLLFVLEIGLTILAWKKLRHKSFSFYYPVSALACLLFSYYMLAILIKSSTALALNQQAYTIPLYYEVLAKLLPGKQALSELESLYRSDFVEINHVNQKLNYPLHPLIYKPLKKPINIVFILIDSWRFDMLNAVNTPNIYRFAKQSWQFQQHFSGGNGTQPGLFSLFYSLPATYWAATINQHKSPVFISKLLAENYHMGIFASAELLAPPFNQNVFVAVKNLKISTLGYSPYDRDKKITKEFKQFITQTPAPFFSFLFYDAAHSFCIGNGPIHIFQPSISVCDRLIYTNHTNPTPTLNRYKNALYYIDQLVGQDLALLKKRHLLENTLVLITADHGNEFNDNHLGYWGHASNFTRFQTQVPLIIHWPGQKPRLIQHRTNHYDVVPTLLTRIFGLQNPIADYSIGQSLLNQKSQPFLLIHSYTNLGLVNDKQILTIYPSGYFQIQNLQAKLLSTESLPMKNVLAALALTNRYYSSDKN